MKIIQVISNTIERILTDRELNAMFRNETQLVFTDTNQPSEARCQKLPVCALVKGLK